MNTVPIFKVVGNQTLDHDGVVYRHGEEVSVEVFKNREDCERLLKLGVLAPANDAARALVDRVERPTAPFVEKPPAPPAPPHKFSLDPAKLADKTLEQLNVILAEMDPTAKPFDDAAEGRAFLSMDYVPA